LARAALLAPERDAASILYAAALLPNAPNRLIGMFTSERQVRVELATAGSWRRARLLLDARTPDYPELRQ